MEDGETGAMSESVEGRQEDEDLSRMSTDLEEERLSESEAQDSLGNVPTLTSETELEPSRDIEDKQADALSQPPETGSEDLDSVDLLDLLGPKPLDFEVIDFDQFGPQPPDFPRSDNTLDHKEVDQSGAEFTQPGEQISHVDSGVAQEMETLSDGPEKTSSSEKDQLQNERYAEPDMDSYHIVPNRIEELQLEDNLPSLTSEDKEGHGVPRDLNSQPTPENVSGEKKTEGSTASEAVQELNRLTQEQAKQLEDVRQQLELSTTQLEKQTKIHEEMKRDLEAESNERLKTEAKLMVLNEVLPNMEEKLRNLSNQLQEQVDLRTQLEDDLQQESKQLEEQVKLRTQLEDDLQQQSTQLEEQVELKNELAATLERRAQYISQLEEQTTELAHKLEEEQDERMRSEADLMVLREMLSNAEEKLKDVHGQVESLVAQVQEQTELKNGLEEKLDWEGKEKLQHHQIHQELALKLEQERGERVKSETSLEELHESLSSKEEELKEALESLSNKEKELKEVYENLSNKDMQLKELRESLSNKEEELRKALESLSNNEEELREVHESLSDKDMQLNEALESLSNKEQELKEVYESLSKKEEELNEALESLSNKEGELSEVFESLLRKEEELKGQRDQVASLTAQLQEKELEEKLEQRMVSDHSTESLPVSSMPWSEEKLELAKLLDEQKTLLANQLLEAEKLKSAAKTKVGLLNHQVQNLEVLTDIAETMEHVFNAKERAIKQAMWTVIQAVCLGMGFLHFVLAYRDPLRSSLQPT